MVWLKVLTLFSCWRVCLPDFLVLVELPARTSFADLVELPTHFSRFSTSFTFLADDPFWVGH